MSIKVKDSSTLRSENNINRTRKDKASQEKQHENTRESISQMKSQWKSAFESHAGWSVEDWKRNKNNCIGCLVKYLMRPMFPFWQSSAHYFLQKILTFCMNNTQFTQIRRCLCKESKYSMSWFPVYLNDLPIPAWNDTTSSPTDLTKITIVGLKPETTYEIKMSAINGKGEGESSPASTFKTEPVRKYCPYHSCPSSQ